METKAKSRQSQDQRDTAVQNTVVVHRVFNLPIKVVWLALTDSEYFKKWWGPKDYTAPYSKIDAKIGGRYLNCMLGPDGKEYWSIGVVKELLPEKKLVITDNFSDKDGNIKSAADYGLPGDWPSEMLITFELEEADGATKLRLVHEGIPPEMHDECLQSWNETFNKLEENIT